MNLRHQKAKPPLKLLQINVGKGSDNHELALATAHQERIDILLIQEPYIFKETSRQITKKHPSFECFVPIDNWVLKPRVLTYVRKGAGLKAEQLRPFNPEDPATRDLLTLSLSSGPLNNILIVNTYNAPIGANNEGAAIKALLQTPNSFFTKYKHLVVLGDFNLHHHYWQPSYQYNTTAAEPFVTWFNQLNLNLVLEADTPTHKLGNTLD